MKPILSSYILFWWGTFVVNVSARGLSGAYERIFFYLVYRIEVEAYGGGAGNGIFGPGCIVQEVVNNVRSSRPCNFNEYINHINTGVADESTEFLPKGQALGLSQADINAAAQSIDSHGGAATDYFDAQNVVPGRTGGNLAAFNGLFDDAGTALTRALQAGARANINLGPLKTAAKTAVNASKTLRSAVFLSNEYNALLRSLPNVNWVTENLPVFTMTVRKINWATTNANPALRNANSQLSRAVKAAKLAFGATDASKSHSTVIKKMYDLTFAGAPARNGQPAKPPGCLG